MVDKVELKKIQDDLQWTSENTKQYIGKTFLKSTVNFPYMWVPYVLFYLSVVLKFPTITYLFADTLQKDTFWKRKQTERTQIHNC